MIFTHPSQLFSQEIHVEDRVGRGPSTLPKNLIFLGFTTTDHYLALPINPTVNQKH
jgi:hypothetical protein